MFPFDFTVLWIPFPTLLTLYFQMAPKKGTRSSSSKKPPNNMLNTLVLPLRQIPCLLVNSIPLIGLPILLNLLFLDV